MPESRSMPAFRLSGRPSLCDSAPSDSPPPVALRWRWASVAELPAERWRASRLEAVVLAAGRAASGPAVPCTGCAVDLSRCRRSPMAEVYGSGWGRGGSARLEHPPDGGDDLAEVAAELHERVTGAPE